VRAFEDCRHAFEDLFADRGCLIGDDQDMRGMKALEALGVVILGGESKPEVILSEVPLRREQQLSAQRPSVGASLGREGAYLAP
jgi:hypothetical protein